MATTEAGGGVPLELRERLAWNIEGSPEFTAHEIADCVLQEIAAAGFELVPTERWGRVRRDAYEYNMLYKLGAQVAKPACQPGDLERPEGRE
jgi:hypothetical protein